LNGTGGEDGDASIVKQGQKEGGQRQTERYFPRKAKALKSMQDKEGLPENTFKPFFQ